MDKWLLSLEKACQKKFYQSEIDELVSYYKEMIEERLSHGEMMDDIIKSYDIEKIVKNITPTMISRRDNDSFKGVLKSAKVLMLALISIPLLLPLGIILIVFCSIVFALGVTILALIFAGIVTVIALVFESITSGLPTPSLLVLLGGGFISVSVITMIALGLFSFFKELLKKTIYYISIYAKKIQGEKQ
jgi:uncharacterized membrane protein